MEGAIQCGLDSPVEENDSDDNETVPDNFEATMTFSGGWMDADVADVHIPPLTLKHIHEFFIAGRLRKERVTATKPFERGYRFFDSKKVQGMSINMVSGSSVYCIVRAAVMPSQKCGEAYTTAIAVNKTNGQVLYGTCNHTAALMFAIDDANRTRESRGSGPPSCTSLPKKWGVPAKSKRGKQPTPVKKLKIVKPTYGKVQQQTPTNTSTREPIDPSHGLVDITRIMSLREDLERNCEHKVLLGQVWPKNPDPTQISQLMQIQLKPKVDC